MTLYPNDWREGGPSGKDDLQSFFHGKIRDRYFFGFEENNMAEVKIVRRNIDTPETLIRQGWGQGNLAGQKPERIDPLLRIFYQHDLLEGGVLGGRKGLDNLPDGWINVFDNGDSDQEILEISKQPGSENVGGDQTHQEDEDNFGENAQPREFNSQGLLQNRAQEAVEKIKEPYQGQSGDDDWDDDDQPGEKSCFQCALQSLHGASGNPKFEESVAGAAVMAGTTAAARGTGGGHKFGSTLEAEGRNLLAHSSALAFWAFDFGRAVENDLFEIFLAFFTMIFKNWHD